MNKLTFKGLERAVALKDFTTYKIGGTAEYFYHATDIKELGKLLIAAQKAEVPVFVLGNGSNILIADKGFKGLVIKNEIKGISIKDNLVTVGAGKNINSVIGQAAESSLGGLEFLAGVPTTLGGAVWGNAGSATENIGQYVEKVTALNSAGESLEYNKAACQFAYRESIFKHNKNIIVEVVLRLVPGELENIKQKITALVQAKREKQDLVNPSCGCVFKNPKTGESAGKLIESLGLKGKKMGGAKISEKHANFIINTGSATAEDVIMLISYVKQQVRDQLGVQLQEEVQYVGFEE